MANNNETVTGGATLVQVGVACRNPGGGWETIILP